MAQVIDGLAHFQYLCATYSCSIDDALLVIHFSTSTGTKTYFISKPWNITGNKDRQAAVDTIELETL